MYVSPEGELLLLALIGAPLLSIRNTVVFAWTPLKDDAPVMYVFAGIPVPVIRYPARITPEVIAPTLTIVVPAYTLHVAVPLEVDTILSCEDAEILGVAIVIHDVSADTDGVPVDAIDTVTVFPDTAVTVPVPLNPVAPLRTIPLTVTTIPGQISEAFDTVY